VDTQLVHPVFSFNPAPACGDARAVIRAEMLLDRRDGLLATVERTTLTAKISIPIPMNIDHP